MSSCAWSPPGRLAARRAALGEPAQAGGAHYGAAERSGRCVSLARRGTSRADRAGGTGSWAGNRRGSHPGHRPHRGRHVRALPGPRQALTAHRARHLAHADPGLASCGWSRPGRSRIGRGRCPPVMGWRCAPFPAVAARRPPADVSGDCCLPQCRVTLDVGRCPVTGVRHVTAQVVWVAKDDGSDIIRADTIAGSAMTTTATSLSSWPGVRARA